MKKPYIICYMMTSLDGRIDCAMTAQMAGNRAYYQVLDELKMPTTLSGRRTAELEMALPEKFQPKDPAVYGKEGFSKKTDAPGYEVIVDTKGTLCWEKETDAVKPHLIITGTQVTKDYLDYLDRQNISWITCGGEKIDLARAAEILAEEFGVERMGVVGGAAIDTGFLNAGLLDEIDIMVGPGIDGRREMPSVFEGRENEHPLPLHFEGVRTFDEGTVLLRYTL